MPSSISDLTTFNVLELCLLFTVAGSGDIHVIWTHSSILLLSVTYGKVYLKLPYIGDLWNIAMLCYSFLPSFVWYITDMG